MTSPSNNIALYLPLASEGNNDGNFPFVNGFTNGTTGPSLMSLFNAAFGSDGHHKVRSSSPRATISAKALQSIIQEALGILSDEDLDEV